MARLAGSDGSARALQVGDEVMPGNAVETGANGSAVLSRAGTSMTLSANGRLEIPTTNQNGVRTTVFQRLGSVLLNVDKRPEQHFQVDTPYLAAVVKGTTFTVNVSDAGAEVHLVEGAVEVGAFGSGEVAMLRPGQTATIGIDASAPLKVMEGQSSAAPPAQRDQQGKAETESNDTAQAAEKPAEADGKGNGEPAMALGRDGGQAAQSTAVTGETLVGDDAGLKGNLTAKGADSAKGLDKGLRITSTLGQSSINIATVTNGLVAPAQPLAGGLVAGAKAPAGSEAADKATGNGGQGNSAVALQNAPGQTRSADATVDQAAATNVFTLGVVGSAASGTSSVTANVADVGASAGGAAGSVGGAVGGAASGTSNGLGNIVGELLGDSGNGNGNGNGLGALVGELTGNNGNGKGLGLGNLLKDKSG